MRSLFVVLLNGFLYSFVGMVNNLNHLVDSALCASWHSRFFGILALSDHYSNLLFAHHRLDFLSLSNTLSKKYNPLQVENHDSQVLTAVIVDDEPAASQAMGKLLSLYCPRVQVIAIADSVMSCVEALAQNDIDLVFLDIELGRESGFDLFTKVRQVDFQVIFTTSYSEFAIKAIRAEAVDYLLKPIDPLELRAAVDRALSRKGDQEIKTWSHANADESDLAVPNNGIAVVTSDGINLLQLEQVVHVEGSGSYSTFYMIDGTTLVASRNLMHYERLIDSQTFFRTHQSHLINLSHLKSFSTNNSQALLIGDCTVPVSKTKKPMLVERIKELYRGV